MTAHQRIVRVRRNYNKWVANQTLEDYALRFTAKSARKWSSLRVANTAIGAISFLALEAIGGAITVNYGVANAVSAILVVGGLGYVGLNTSNPGSSSRTINSCAPASSPVCAAQGAGHDITLTSPFGRTAVKGIKFPAWTAFRTV